MPVCASSAVDVMQSTRSRWPLVAMRARLLNNSWIWSLNSRERVSPETENACAMAALMCLSVAAAWMTLPPEKLVPQ